MNFEGTKLGRCDPVSVIEFLKRITTFTHFAGQKHLGIGWVRRFAITG